MTLKRLENEEEIHHEVSIELVFPGVHFSTNISGYDILRLIKPEELVEFREKVLVQKLLEQFVLDLLW